MSGRTGYETSVSRLSDVCGSGQSDAPVLVLPPQPQPQERRMADEWPLQDFVELGALPTAVPCARMRTRQVLWEWGLAKCSEQVELLVSELMTNAIKASQSLERLSPVRLWLLSDKQHLLILVWDGNHWPPVRIDAGQDAESGRGLLLVEALSDGWGSYAHTGWGGKIVWCEVLLGSPSEMTRQFPEVHR
jgi:anti-sigma regulatory factor (Ser/Thr protein kinase)